MYDLKCFYVLEFHLLHEFIKLVILPMKSLEIKKYPLKYSSECPLFVYFFCLFSYKYYLQNLDCNEVLSNQVIIEVGKKPVVKFSPSSCFSK